MSEKQIKQLQQRVEFLELITGIKYDIELYEKAEFIAIERFDKERVEIVTDYIKILKGEGGAAK